MDIRKLHKKRNNRAYLRLQYYDKVLGRCHKRIKFASNKMETFCFFVIPEIVFGIPLYNTIDCTYHIINNLRKDGFIVVYTHPNLLFISWEIVPRIEPKKQITYKKPKKYIKGKQKKKKKYKNPENTTVYSDDFLKDFQSSADNLFND